MYEKNCYFVKSKECETLEDPSSCRELAESLVRVLRVHAMALSICKSRLELSELNCYSRKHKSP